MLCCFLFFFFTFKSVFRVDFAFFVDACARHTTFYPTIFWSCPYYLRNQPQGITQSMDIYLMITRRLLSLNVLQICLCLNQPTEKKNIDWERAQFIRVSTLKVFLNIFVGEKSKHRWNNIHTMAEGKAALQVLLNMVSETLFQNRFKGLVVIYS